MAVKKVGGSTRNGRDSVGRRLGLKRNHLQFVKTSTIIIRQRGKKYYCGINTYYGRDHTIHALTSGIVHFFKKKSKTFVSIIK